MTEVFSKSLDKTIKINRLIGKYSGNKPGPCMVFFGGIHGNEPASIFALNFVLQSLSDLNPGFNGVMYAIGGNLGALSKSIRYVDEDLNRIWGDDDNGVSFGREKGIYEFKERNEIISELSSILDSGSHPIYAFDLHTTSAESTPFIAISDTLRSRAMVKKVPVPIILGLEEQMEGTLFNCLTEIGVSTVIFESGQHQALSSIENHTAFIWEMLANTGCITPASIPNFQKYFDKLKKNTLGERKIFEVRYVHFLKPGDEFKMNAGFVNFEEVEKGEVVAEDKTGKIKVKEDGEIFMPLYQELGDEGFFVIKHIKSFWLGVSEFLRKLKIDSLFRFFPGVRRDKNEASTFYINTHVAFLFVLEIFHLFGYRREKKVGNVLIVSRREYDSKEPSIEELRRNFRKKFAKEFE